MGVLCNSWLVAGVWLLFAAVHSHADEFGNNPIESTPIAQSFQISGSRFRLYFVDHFTTQEQAKLKAWIQQACAAVTLTYGKFPIPNVDVVLHKASRANEPVPWGQVKRPSKIRDYPQVLFHVNPSYSLKAFQDDWVAVHEFSHLLLPFAGEDDIWLSEGLATYYQNVLRARHNMLSEAMAWQKLLEGFKRGKNDIKYNHLNLASLSPIMRETGSYMRVYWSGTAYFLALDVKLRQQSKNQTSLDSVLAKFHQCCLPSKRRWTGAALVAKLDELSDSQVFSEYYQRYRGLQQHPDIKPLLKQLGVSLSWRGVSIVNEAPLKDIRKAIMSVP